MTQLHKIHSPGIHENHLHIKQHKKNRYQKVFDGKRNTVFSSNVISVDPKLGLEASVKNVFFIRGGLNNLQKITDESDSSNTKKVWIYQPSIGAGFKISNVQIDYAFTNLANQSNPLYTHIFSLKLDLVKKPKKK